MILRARRSCPIRAAAVIGFAFVTLLAAVARAQVPILPPRPPERVVAVVNATVLTAAGPPIVRGTVICKGSKIEQVGAELSAPAGAEVIDARGGYVSPGLVAIEAAAVGVGGTDGNIADSLDPYQLSLRVALACGITTANVVDVPFPGFFGEEVEAISGAGSAVIKLTQGDLEGMLVREPGLNYFAMPGRQVGLNLFRVRESFRKASEHLKALREAETKKTQPPRTPPELEPFVTILQNERPTVVTAGEEEEVNALLEIQREYPFDLILSRPDAAFGVARSLASRRVPVLLKARGADFSFDFTTPVVDEHGLIPIRRPSAFWELGVSVALLPYRRGVSLDGLAGRDLTAYHLEAAFAVRGGMSEENALEAITIVPARLLRIGDRVGSLERGKDADLLVWNRHPLDFRAFVEKAFINGKLYYEREKSTLFRGIPLK
jgi:hypothetical protein